MRPARPILLALLAALLQPPAAADQNDPRLDRLFEQLRATDDAAEGRRITREIRFIWRETDDIGMEVLLSEGLQLLRAHQYQRALDVYTRAIAEQPDHAEPWSKRAAVHYLLGDYQRALEDVRRTLALEPRHFGAMSELGAILIRLDRDEEALEVLREALAVNPHLSGARRNLELIRARMADQLS